MESKGKKPLQVVRIWIDPDSGALAPFGKVIHSYSHFAYTEEGSASLINPGFSALDAGRKTKADHKKRCKAIFEGADHLGPDEREAYNPERQAYFFLLANGQRTEDGRELYDVIREDYPKGATASEKNEARKEFNRTRSQQ